jgi:hypothetical protein
LPLDVLLHSSKWMMLTNKEKRSGIKVSGRDDNSRDKEA